MAITDFLTAAKTVTPSTPVASFPSGYVSSTFDIITQQSLRQHHVTQNKVFDYGQAELDPNFKRSNPTNAATLNTLITKLSLSTQILGIATNMTKMLGTAEFIPDNVLQLLTTLSILSTTSSSMIGTARQSNVTTLVAAAVAADLLGQFNLGGLNFAQVASLSTQLSQNPVSNVPFLNGSLGGLTPLPVSSVLPTSPTAVLTTVAYTNALDQLYPDDLASQAAYTAALTDGLTAYAGTTISTIVTQDYDSVVIDLDDPLGLNAHQSFLNDIESSYLAALAKLVSDQNILAVLSADASANVNDALRSTIGLPSLANCAKAITSLSKANVYDGFVQGVSQFVNTIINDLGINGAPSTVTPINYLINIQRNIQFRESLKISGASLASFRQVEDYFVDIIPGNVDEATLDALALNLQKLLGTNG